MQEREPPCPYSPPPSVISKDRRCCCDSSSYSILKDLKGATIPPFPLPLSEPFALLIFFPSPR